MIFEMDYNFNKQVFIAVTNLGQNIFCMHNKSVAHPGFYTHRQRRPSTYDFSLQNKIPGNDKCICGVGHVKASLLAQ